FTGRTTTALKHDRAIPSPIVFEIHGDRHVETAAAYKRPNQADPGKWVIGDNLRGGRLPTDAPRTALPAALDAAGLYQAILQSLVPLAPRTGETLDAQLERLATIRKLEKACARLEKRVRREKQFNRRVEINRDLREQKNRLAQLY